MIFIAEHKRSVLEGKEKGKRGRDEIKEKTTKNSRHL